MPEKSSNLSANYQHIIIQAQKKALSKKFSDLPFPFKRAFCFFVIWSYAGITTIKRNHGPRRSSHAEKKTSRKPNSHKPPKQLLGSLFLFFYYPIILTHKNLPKKQAINTISTIHIHNPSKKTYEMTTALAKSKERAQKASYV